MKSDSGITALARAKEHPPPLLPDRREMMVAGMSRVNREKVSGVSGESLMNGGI